MPGGFAGHVTNDRDQRWTYEPDPDAPEVTARWSPRRRGFYTPGSTNPLTTGRHEFYDHNF